MELYTYKFDLEKIKRTSTPKKIPHISGNETI